MPGSIGLCTLAVRMPGGAKLFGVSRRTLYTRIRHHFSIRSAWEEIRAYRSE